jgi:hypothetical protein
MISAIYDHDAPAAAIQAPTSGPDDGAIRALFQRWLRDTRAASALHPGNDDRPGYDDFKKAWEAADDIIDDIADLPARSLSDLAIKAYLTLFRMTIGGTPGDACAVRLYDLDYSIAISLAKDLAAIEPDLEPLCRQLIEAEAEDESEGVLTDGPGT